MVAATLDPDGRRVSLTDERWLHIKSRRPQLGGYLREIMTAVREPSRRVDGRASNEEWFFLEDAGPARWLQVVVHYEGGEGWIVTAFPRRSPAR